MCIRDSQRSCLVGGPRRRTCLRRLARWSSRPPSAVSRRAAPTLACAEPCLPDVPVKAPPPGAFDAPA
eukprot:12730591-Alexandrium_andersonii.AAC.1